jgi:RNA polymerase sigma-70 factor, ECF subfamily
MFAVPRIENRFENGFVTVSTEKAAATPADAADDALVLRAQAGDTDAFESIVRKYRNEVYAFSYSFVRNREQAWDLSQEVFVKAWKSIKRFRREARLKTWLMRITANHCRDYLKKRRLETVAFDDAIRADAPGTLADPAESLAARELGRAIEKAVAALPHKHRTAFILREYQGLSYQEMAEVMECSPGTVMSRLHHARAKLQQALIRMGVVEETRS